MGQGQVVHWEVSWAGSQETWVQALSSAPHLFCDLWSLLCSVSSAKHSPRQECLLKTSGALVQTQIFQSGSRENNLYIRGVICILNKGLGGFRVHSADSLMRSNDMVQREGTGKGGVGEVCCPTLTTPEALAARRSPAGAPPRGPGTITKRL